MNTVIAKIDWARSESSSSTSRRPAAGRAVTGFGSSLLAAFATVARWCRARQTVHRLAYLEDRLLTDIGITRVELERIFRRGR
jgi:uncharacterized protein YjiS (DUF1127 family)